MKKGFSVFHRGLPLRKGVKPVLAALLLLVFVFTLFSTVGAQIEPQAVNSLDLSAVRDCPDGIGQRLPSRVVLQYIDGVFHKWEEYDLDKKGTYCIFLRKPEQRRLSVGEAKTLLENSARWREQGPPPGISQTVDTKNDPYYLAPPAAPKLPDNFQINNSPASQEPDRPAPSGYPGKEPRSGVHPERLPLPRAEDVVGADDRIRVIDTETYPWNTVGFIGNTYPSGNSYRGSGAIVSPYMVLTAGHMVYNWDTEGGYASEIVFFPGQTQTVEGGTRIRPYGQFTTASRETNSNYIDALKTNPSDQFRYDYATVFFNTSFASVGITTYMPVVFSISPPIGDIINLAGYPGSVKGETNSQAMWQSSGDVTSVTDRILYYNADTTGGNSGGPVWQLTSGLRRIIAVHVVSTPGGCRLVSQNQGVIEAWMQWVPSGGGGGGDSEGGGGCFIATAAYGSYLDPHVQILRNFRDQYLLKNGPGRVFVRLYNHYSPPAASFIKDHDILRAATRILLTPVVYAVKYPSGFLAACCLMVIVGGVYGSRRRLFHT
ncbi:MAG: CFI-box-CTERM domain-containing protein [Syntrophales bacterium]|nr:CFI-box-CTERM domain-containing protein [Syntrophales bacterium]